MKTLAMGGLLPCDDLLELLDREGGLRPGPGRGNRGARGVEVLLEAPGDMPDDGELELMAMEPGPGAAEVCPAPPGITGRESAVLDKDVGRVHGPDLFYDPVHLLRFPRHLETEAGLLDHRPGGDLDRPDRDVLGGEVRGLDENIDGHRPDIGRGVAFHGTSLT